MIESMKLCTVTTCGREVFARGWCKPHWHRWRRTGDIRVNVPIAARIDGDFAARFWAKVDKTGDCWLWLGARNADGYGHFTHWNDGKRVSPKAHRLAWELHFGKIPTGMHVCHHCDTPPCVRVDHLFLGTPLINARDKVSKGRLRVGDPTGEANGHAKLTEAQVLEIRARVAAGEKQVRVSLDYGIGPQAVNGIIKRRSWKHI